MTYVSDPPPTSSLMSPGLPTKSECSPLRSTMGTPPSSKQTPAAPWLPTRTMWPSPNRPARSPVLTEGSSPPPIFEYAGPGTARIIDPDTLDEVATLRGSAPMAFSPDSSVLLVGDFGVGYVYEVGTWELLATLSDPDTRTFVNDIYADAHFLSDGKHVLTADDGVCEDRQLGLLRACRTSQEYGEIEGGHLAQRCAVDGSQ